MDDSTNFQTTTNPVAVEQPPIPKTTKADWEDDDEDADGFMDL